LDLPRSRPGPLAVSCEHGGKPIEPYTCNPLSGFGDERRR